MKAIRRGNRLIGTGQPCFPAAETGINRRRIWVRFKSVDWPIGGYFGAGSERKLSAGPRGTTMILLREHSHQRGCIGGRSK